MKIDVLNIIVDKHRYNVASNALKTFQILFTRVSTKRIDDECAQHVMILVKTIDD